MGQMKEANFSSGEVTNAQKDIRGYQDLIYVYAPKKGYTS